MSSNCEVQAADLAQLVREMDSAGFGSLEARELLNSLGFGTIGDIRTGAQLAQVREALGSEVRR